MDHTNYLSNDTRRDILRQFYTGESPRLIAIGLRWRDPRLTERDAERIVIDTILFYGGHYKEFKETGEVIVPDKPAKIKI